MSLTQIKANEICEIIHAIGVCNQVASAFRRHISEGVALEAGTINELVTNLNCGGLELAIKHLETTATNKVEWIEEFSTDKA